MVRQHHAAGADADALGAAGHVANDDRRRRAGDTGHVVVLGDPKALKAQAFGGSSELEGLRERLAWSLACRDRREIEDRERDHEVSV